MTRLPSKRALPAPRDQVRARLTRAHGHLHGVVDMMDAGRDYSEILQQLVAVRAALDKATGVILDDMVNNLDTAPAKTVAELRAAIRALA